MWVAFSVLFVWTRRVECRARSFIVRFTVTRHGQQKYIKKPMKCQGQHATYSSCDLLIGRNKVISFDCSKNIVKWINFVSLYVLAKIRNPGDSYINEGREDFKIIFLMNHLTECSYIQCQKVTRVYTRKFGQTLIQFRWYFNAP